MSINEIAHTKFSHDAMAAPFHVFIAAEDQVYAGQAAGAAFAEVDVVEGELSRFIDSSDVSQINHSAPHTPVRVGVHTYDCLKVAFEVNQETDGAFDVTIGPLLEWWRKADTAPATAEELARARERVGMSLLDFDEAARTVAIKKSGVQIDLGGIGKGYGLERAAAVLREWDIERALLSAGGSTVLALDAPPDRDGWPVGVGGVGNEAAPRRTIFLRNGAVSGSGFAVKGRHIMDPRTGRPADGKLGAWSLCPSATKADALSTAFLVMDVSAVERYCTRHPDTSAMLILPEKDDKQVYTFGKW